jgi:hypothetical protein
MPFGSRFSTGTTPGVCSNYIFAHWNYLKFLILSLYIRVTPHLKYLPAFPSIAFRVSRTNFTHYYEPTWLQVTFSAVSILRNCKNELLKQSAVAERIAFECMTERKNPPVFWRTKEPADIQIAIANTIVTVTKKNVNSLQYFNFPCFGPHWSVIREAVVQNYR